MGDKLNKGLIYTNDKCIGCNRCISGCPVLCANVSLNEEGHNRIYVDGDKCLHCGHCLETCRHGAREYRDDTERFFHDLAVGEELSLVVAPAFFIDYQDQAEEILGYLQKAGVKNVYPVSFGADITTWGYMKYLAQHHGASGISQPCPAIVNYVEKYAPELITKLMPIHSPLMCAAIYIHKYLGDTSKLAFLGPCIAKKDEIDAKETGGNVQYNVTFRRLLEHLEGIDMSGCKADMKLTDYGLGAVYPTVGGLRQNIEHFLGYDELVRQVDGESDAYPYLREYSERVSEGKRLPLLVDILNCRQGCIVGTATCNKLVHNDDIMFALQDKKRSSVVNNDFEGDNPYSGIISREERRQRLNKKFEHLKLEDFIREYDYDKVVVKPEVGEDYDDIFNSMYKYTEADRIIDCHSCGYDSCKDMVRAIASGHNRKENCVHYMKDENLRLYVTDPLTGAPNTNAYMRKVSQVLLENRGAAYTTIFFNIRNFKLVNKKYGSRTGDQVLINYAKYVSALVGDDEIIARWGGDQFVGLVYNEHLDEILRQLSFVTLNVVREGEEDEECQLAARIAVYMLTGEEGTAQQVMGQVATTYAAMNKHGKDHVIYFDEELSSRILHDITIEEMLEPALRNKEFVVYYQPKVSMKDRSLVGAEALVRWERDGQLIPPMEFIPLCENNGFVRQIDFYVLERVCEDIHTWLEQGYDMVKISFNFSKQHFVDENVAEKINEIATKWKIPKEYLEVEFTETAYIDDYDNLVATIDKLRDMGISSSIDDFGTGYSSLSLLQNLEFNTLKLDKSFLREREKDNRNKTVIANIIHMAQELDMDIIAEGIETKEDFCFLKNLSCDVAQGFLFDKPLPKEEFEKRLLMKIYS